MYEWNEMVQRMVDWVEEHLSENDTLLKMSRHLGYSPYYCFRQFNRVTGMTLRNYVRIRRLSRAALELRDTDRRVLDIAAKYGEIPKSEYLVFYHPPFDYLRDNGAVMGAVEDIAWSFDPGKMGYEWDEEAKQDYQRHFPERYGYAVLRPVRKKTV